MVQLRISFECRHGVQDESPIQLANPFLLLPTEVKWYFPLNDEYLPLKSNHRSLENKLNQYKCRNYSRNKMKGIMHGINVNVTVLRESISSKFLNSQRVRRKCMKRYSVLSRIFWYRLNHQHWIIRSEKGQHWKHYAMAFIWNVS